VRWSILAEAQLALHAPLSASELGAEDVFVANEKQQLRRLV
jgi:hypothetical protein